MPINHSKTKKEAEKTPPKEVAKEEWFVTDREGNRYPILQLAGTFGWCQK